MKNRFGTSWPQAGFLTKQTKKSPTHRMRWSSWYNGEEREKGSSGNLFQRLEAIYSEGTDTSLVTRQGKGASEYQTHENTQLFYASKIMCFQILSKRAETLILNYTDNTQVRTELLMYSVMKDRRRGIRCNYNSINIFLQHVPISKQVSLYPSAFLSSNKLLSVLIIRPALRGGD